MNTFVFTVSLYSFSSILFTFVFNLTVLSKIFAKMNNDAHVENLAITILFIFADLSAKLAIVCHGLLEKYSCLPKFSFDVSPTSLTVFSICGLPG